MKLNKTKAKRLIKAYEDDFYSTEALVMSYLTGEEPNSASKISIDYAVQHRRFLQLRRRFRCTHRRTHIIRRSLNGFI